MKNIHLGCLFFCLITHAQAQNLRLDSLQKAYKAAKKDTVRILTLIEIAHEYNTQKPDTTILLAKKALYQAQKINFTKGIAWASNRIGLAYWLKSNYTEALSYTQKSTSIFEKNNDLLGLSNSWNTLGNIFSEQKNYAKALNYYQKSLQIRNKIGNQADIAASLSNIGTNYLDQNDYLKALDYYQKSLEIQENLKNEWGIAAVLNNIADIYVHQGKYTEALAYQKRAFDLSEKLGETYIKTATLLGMAQVYQKLQNYEQSIRHAQQSLSLAKENNYLLATKESSGILYESFKRQGFTDKALVYHELYKQVNDSLFNIEKTKKIATLEALMELEKKELQLLKAKEAKKAQEFINTLILTCLIILLCSILYILYAFRKMYHDKNKINYLNQNLEKLVKQRTEKLIEKNQQLEEYAFFNAHKLRRPVASIMGIHNLLREETNPQQQFELLEYLNRSVNELDKVVRQIQEIVRED
jgi:tetratricopeptide (TPR) repeat protein